MLSYTDMGKGFGFWNTMPMLRRSSVTSTPGAKMSCPRKVTLPSMRQPSTRSFMRLSVFKNVDLPQPDGPIRAVMACAGTSMHTLCSA